MFRLSWNSLTVADTFYLIGLFTFVQISKVFWCETTEQEVKVLKHSNDIPLKSFRNTVVIIPFDFFHSGNWLFLQHSHTEEEEDRMVSLSIYLRTIRFDWMEDERILLLPLNGLISSWKKPVTHKIAFPSFCVSRMCDAKSFTEIMISKLLWLITWNFEK